MRQLRLVPFAVLHSVLYSALYSVLSAGPCAAQWRATMDVGFARLSQAGIPESNATTVGGGIDRAGEWNAVQMNALASQTGDNRWTIQSASGATLFTAPSHGVRAELTALLGTYSANTIGPTVSTELMAAARVGAAEQGGSVGIGGGSSSHDERTAPLLHARSDLWRVMSKDRLSGTLSFVRTQLPELDDESDVATTLRSLSYADFSAAWQHDFNAVSVGAASGLRAAVSGVAESGTWASVNATAWIGARTALVASVGRTLDDPVHGLPRTRYASLAAHLATSPHAVPASHRHAIAGPQVTVSATGAGRHRIEVSASNASRVEIAGDFTNWNPVVLERDGSVWRADRLMTPGLHRIAVRIDGGEWIAPANIPRATDDLGGVFGLITIP